MTKVTCIRGYINKECRWRCKDLCLKEEININADGECLTEEMIRIKKDESQYEN